MTEVDLKFKIYGDNFSPSDVTQLLDVQPTRVTLKGDDIIYTINDGVIVKTNRFYKTTTWEFSTGWVETYDSNDLISSFLELFENKANTIADFLKDNMLEAIIVLDVDIDESAPSLLFERELIEFLHTSNTLIIVHI